MRPRVVKRGVEDFGTTEDGRDTCDHKAFVIGVPLCLLFVSVSLSVSSPYFTFPHLSLSICVMFASRSVCLSVCMIENGFV